jgi:hypothetical protein
MQRNAELAEYLTRLYALFATGDVSLADELLSSEADILGVGTDPREWWLGDAFRDAARTQPAEMHAAGLRFEPGEVLACSEGSIGWFADQPTLKLPDGGDVPMRLTGICRQEDGAWKMVQLHLSIGIMNEEALGEELTI